MLAKLIHDILCLHKDNSMNNHRFKNGDLSIELFSLLIIWIYFRRNAFDEGSWIVVCVKFLIIYAVNCIEKNQVYILKNIAKLEKIIKDIII